MKSLFFVAVATGIFTGTSISSKAQTNVNLERFSAQAKPKVSPKFIEGIEITPEKISNEAVVSSGEVNGGLTLATTKVFNTSSSASTLTIENCSALQFKYATMMDRDVESISNVVLYNYIDEWWGTRYRYGGTDKKGIDCSAFVGQLVQAAYGVSLPRTAKDQFKACEKVANEELKEGDLLFFNTRGGVSHVGLYLGDNYFVHSSVNGGVTISSLTDDYYSRKFISGGRLVMQQQ
jgi:lipoprotein Spr